MTIKRIVNGVEMEFELTNLELYNAYAEQQHNFDRLDVLGYLNEFSDEQLVNDYGMTRVEAEMLIDDMADRMRRYMDKYECDWSYARDEAVSEILNENKEA